MCMSGIGYVGISGVLLGFKDGVCLKRGRGTLLYGLLICTCYYAYHHFVHLLLQVYILSLRTGCGKLRVSIFVTSRSWYMVCSR